MTQPGEVLDQQRVRFCCVLVNFCLREEREREHEQGKGRAGGGDRSQIGCADS